MCDGRSETELSPTTVSLLQESSWAQTQSTGTLQKCTGSRNVNRVEWLQLCKVHRIFCPNVPPSGEEHFYLPHPSPHVWGCDAWLQLKKRHLFLQHHSSAPAPCCLQGKKRHRFGLETQQFQCHSSKAANGTEFHCYSRTISKKGKTLGNWVSSHKRWD